MLTYGSQVNPALLRQDFSPILQGAQAQAQGITQAAQARAQMMANIGSQISEGFKTYLQNREKNSILEGKNSALLRSMEKDTALSADPEFQKLREKQIKNGGLSFADNAKMNAMLVTYDEQNRLRQEQEMKRIYAANAQAATERQKYDLDQERARNQSLVNYYRNLTNLGPEATTQQKIDAMIAANVPLRDIKDVLGVDVTLEQLNQNTVDFRNRLTDRTQDLINKASDREFVERVRRGDEKGYRIETDTNTGASLLLTIGPGGIQQTQVIKVPQEKDDRGTKAEQYRTAYFAAKGMNDQAAMRAAAINYGSAAGISGGPEIAAADLERSANKGMPALEVTGGLKPVALPAFNEQMPGIGRLGLGKPPTSGPTLVDIARGTGTARADANEATANFLRGAKNRIGELLDRQNWSGVPSKGGGAMVYENKTKLDNLKGQLRALSNKDSFAAEKLRKQIDELEKKPSPLK